MAGIKGRSGRKSKSNEAKRLAIIEKAWDIVGEFLNDEKLDRNYRLQYAIDIVKRNIPQEIKGQGFGDTKIIILQRKEESGKNPNGEIPSRLLGEQ